MNKAQLEIGQEIEGGLFAGKADAVRCPEGQ